ncbi:MAG: hypothetical protein ACYTEZ_06125 [Planctomycetota bacterium]|jgi:hypothetical protein
MTEDPVKFYVVVMTVLLCAAGYGAWLSYDKASAFETALERAPRESKQLKELASEVSALCKQLGQSKLGRGYSTLIQDAANRNGLRHSRVGQIPRDEPVGTGRKGRRRRFNYVFGGTRASPPGTRDQIAKFCQAVERDSQGILKTLEIKLTRYSGPGEPPPGRQDKVIGDKYKGTVIFGFQFIE